MPEPSSITTLSAGVRSGLALLSGVLACIAIALAVNDPDVTYSSEVIDASGDIQVTCTDDVSDGSSERTGAVADAPLLDAGELLRGRYEVTRGKDVLDSVISNANEENSISGMVQRGINADCAAARTHRTTTAVWVVGSGLVAASAALVAPSVLSRRRIERDGARA